MLANRLKVSIQFINYLVYVCMRTPYFHIFKQEQKRRNNILESVEGAAYLINTA